MSDLQPDSMRRRPGSDSVPRPAELLTDAAGVTISDDECLRRLDAAVR